MKTCLECGSKSVDGALHCFACGGGSWSEYESVPAPKKASEVPPKSKR
jgi:uncharacterized membrane protein YvbJ